MYPARYLPHIAKPPHDPTSLLLNGRAGWLIAKLDQVEVTLPEKRLALALLPSVARSLTEPSGSFGGLVLPGNSAFDRGGGLYLLDLASLALKHFDGCTCAFVTIPCFGGGGSGARQLQNPHGIGICGNNLFVCDTDNHRLSVFALANYGLRGQWSPPRAEQPVPWTPYAVAFDSRRRVYVTDPANGLIHRFASTGQWQVSFGGFGAATWIAIDCEDRIYVVVNNVPPFVSVIDTDGHALGSATSPGAIMAKFAQLPVVIDKAGALHLSSLCEEIDESTTARSCSPKSIDSSAERGVFDLNGNHALPSKPTSSPIYPKIGVYFSEPLDSELYGCQWHRVILNGEIPAGAQVVVSTFSAEALYPDGEIQAPTFTGWRTQQRAVSIDDVPWDCLVRSGPGRYMWLKLELKSDGKVTPALNAIVIEFPRVSLRRYLPAVFGADAVSADFTDRYLSLFDTTMRSVEYTIDGLARYFDPASTPATRGSGGRIDFLSWLASWIGVALDRHWPEAKRRQFLKHAGQLFDLRGTREGLHRQLVLFLGMDAQANCCPGDQPKARCLEPPPNCAPIEQRPCAWTPPPFILEHFALRRWLFVGAGRLGDDAMLWGNRIVNRSQLNSNAQAGGSQLISTPDPYRDPFHVYAHQFTVFVPARCRTAEQRKSLENLLKSESPAHTRFYLEYVEPRFRIGVQSMIGFDSVIGRVPRPMALGQRLGDVSLFAPTADAAPSLRIGVNTQLN